MPHMYINTFFFLTWDSTPRRPFLGRRITRKVVSTFKNLPKTAQDCQDEMWKLAFLVVCVYDVLHNDLCVLCSRAGAFG